MLSRVIFCGVLWAGLEVGGGTAAAQLPDPGTWGTRRLSAQERTALVGAAEERGWDVAAPRLREAVFRAHAAGRFDVAEEWLGLARWADLFALSERDFIPRWIDAVETAGVGHGAMAASYTAQPALLGESLPSPLRRKLADDAEFTREFFEVLVEVDYVPEVFRVLAALDAAIPAAEWTAYHSLILALAIVHDVPPPPRAWPHGQVSPAALPRRLPTPVETFRFLVDGERAGKMWIKPSRLGAAELRFVVDAAAPLAELTWAQQNLKGGLDQLPAVYDDVVYRRDRFTLENYHWPGRSYTLADILRQGGICVDQAYVATHAGKARGVPTLFFRGAGLDGRHAWFGYQDERGTWQLDAGRHEEQRYVTGYAIDPQTWGDLSDHDLQFLQEGFRRLPPWRQSLVHSGVAELALVAGDLGRAGKAARSAVQADRRNESGWEVLLATATDDGRAREGLLREAVAAFRSYPDLETRFMIELLASLRARGETSAADFEERHLARRYQDSRADVTTRIAASIVRRSLAGEPPLRQWETYKSVLNNFSRGAGTDFFDDVVRPFVLAQKRRGDTKLAEEAIERATSTLKPKPDSQLARELAALQLTLSAR